MKILGASSLLRSLGLDTLSLKALLSLSLSLVLYNRYYRCCSVSLAWEIPWYLLFSSDLVYRK